MTPWPLRRSCLLALAALAWCAAPLRAQVPEALAGRPVRQVELRSEGRRVSDAQIEGLVEIRTGQPLAMDDVRKTIVHLMGMGRYVDVQVTVAPDADGVRVELELVPLREVRRMVFTGDLGLAERELRIADAPAFRPQLHLAHGAARERLRHLRLQRRRAPRERGERQDARQAERPAGHLKTYRTRTSSA
jgi:hypothetical protein